MPTIIAAVVAFAATTFTVVGITVTGAFLIQAAIVTAAMAFTYFSAVGAMSLGDSISGRQEMIRQPISPRRKVYGSVRLSGPLGYIGTTGTKNKFLYLTPLLAGHLLTSIGNVYFNDEELTGSKYSSVAQVEKTDLGADTQVASALLQEVPEWTVNHKLSGIAHLPAKLTFDQEKYSGIPTIKADVQGAKVYDPRKDSTNGGTGAHRLSTPATWEYSTNPILCIADYYGDDIVGMNLDTATVIHWPTVITQANICDEVVTKAGGSGTESRYTLNGTILSNQNPGDVLPDMLTSCSGTIVNNLEGLIYIYAGAWQAPTVTLTEDDLAGDLQIIDKASRANLFNYITGTYYNGATHQPDEFPAVTNATYVTEDGDDELRASIELPYTDGSSESQRIANNELSRTRDQTVVMFPANIEALDLIAYDTVLLTLDFYGYTDETFRIIDYTLDIPNGTVMLTLKQESAASWTWTAGDFAVPDTNQASTFPDPYTVNAPVLNAFVNSARIVEDGTVQSSVDVPFTQSDDRSIIQYEVQYKRTADTEWIPAARIPSPVDANDTSVLRTRVESLEPNVNYDFRVRARNYAGNFSLFDTEASWTTSGDVTAPSVPTGLTITPSISSLNINWVNPSEEDFNAIKVYRRINSTSPSESDLLTTLSGDRSKISRYIDFVAATTTYFYWIRSVDRTGNESALTAFVSGAATSIASEGADWVTNLTSRPIELTDGRIPAVLEVGGRLAQTAVVNQGDGVGRAASKGAGYQSVRDGDAFTFDTAWASGSIPKVTLLTGGIVTSATLTNPIIQNYYALSTTVTGFTAVARLKELAATVTDHTDTGAVEDITDIQWSMDKSVATEADDDTYTFQFDVTVENIPDEPGFYVAGQVTVGIYINAGAGFVQYGTLIVNGAFGTNATTVKNNQTKPVIVDGVGTIAGKEFRVVRESSTGQITNFDSVKYTTSVAAADETATPTGAKDVEFQVLGGTEIV